MSNGRGSADWDRECAVNWSVIDPRPIAENRRDGVGGRPGGRRILLGCGRLTDYDAKGAEGRKYLTWSYVPRHPWLCGVHSTHPVAPLPFPPTLRIAISIVFACACGPGCSEAERDAANQDASTDASDAPEDRQPPFAQPDGCMASTVEVMAVDQYRAVGVETDEAHIYWLANEVAPDAGSWPSPDVLRRIPKSGGQPVDVAAGRMFAGRIRLEGQSVFLGASESSDAKLVRVDKAGGVLEDVYAPCDEADHGIGGFDLDDVSLCWACEMSGIYCRPRGADTVSNVVPREFASFYGHVLLDSDSMFWTSSQDHNWFPLRAMNRTTEEKRALVNRFVNRFLAQDAENLYYVDAEPDPKAPRIMSVSKSSAEITVLLQVDGEIVGFDVDESHVYWAQSDGTILSADSAGPQTVATVIACDGGDVSDLAVDGDGVYWTTRFDGSVAWIRF